MYARIVTLEHGMGTYRDVNLLDSSWGIESIYVLCDAKDIYGMSGELEGDLLF